jgi:hypothetical protein
LIKKRLFVICALFTGPKQQGSQNSKVVLRESLGMYVHTVFCILVYNKSDVSLFSDAASKYVTSGNFSDYETVFLLFSHPMAAIGQSWWRWVLIG